MGHITLTAHGVAQPRSIVIKSVHRQWNPKGPMKVFEESGQPLTTGEESAYYPNLDVALDKAFAEVRATVAG